VKRSGNSKSVVGPGSYDRTLFTVILVLLAFGTAMIYSASAFMASQRTVFGSPTFFLKRQLIRLSLGLALMILVMHIDYRLWRRLSKPLLVVGIILLAVLAAGHGMAIRGARRWLLHIQPADLVKVAVVVYLAAFLERKAQVVRDFSKGLLPPLMVLLLVVILLVLQPNFGTATALIFTWMLTMFVGGARLSHLIGVGGLLSLSMLGGALIMPHGKARIEGYLATLRGTGGGVDQLSQSLLSVGSGGIFGVGLGEGKQKLLILPEPHTDFIFATVSEELGFLGAAALLVLFMILIYRGFVIARDAPDRFGSCLAGGLTSLVMVYVVMHVSVVLGLLPVTGLPLPFVSYGGSALISTLVAMGIVLNISRWIGGEWRGP
jgi:cell division protein FtsW